jgi:hypothetical protein
MLYYGENCFKYCNQESKNPAVNRDIYAEIYRTKLGHPWRRGRAWPMRKLEAGAGQ